MEFSKAQEDMSYAYYGGATGVFVSGIIWGTAGCVALLLSQFASMLTLFFGGMLIHPLAILMSKLLGRPGVHSAENPLGKLALESTIILFVGLFIAFYSTSYSAALFFPVMLMTIGVRYLIFQSLYCNKSYWLMGAILMLAGGLCMVLGAPFFVGAFIGGTTEIVFALLIMKQVRSFQHQVA